MTGTNLVFSVDIGTGFDEDGDDASMAKPSGLHKGGYVILHSRDTIRCGEVAYIHSRLVAASCTQTYVR